MDIQVLGPGCRNCVTLEARVTEALQQLGTEATVSKVTDPAAIVAAGVMATPALVVDGQLVLAGSVPSVRKLTGLLQR
jgi:small redox-active disulfide protein 2